MTKVDKCVRDSLIIDSVSDRIWEYNILTGETNIVKSLINFLGYDKFEFRTDIDFFFTLIHPDDIEGLLNAFNEISSGKSDYFKVQYRIRLEDDEYMLVKSNGKVLKDEKGRDVYIAGLHLDIRPYRQSEENEQKSQTLFNNVNDIALLAEINKKIIDLSPLGVYIVNDGIITYANAPGLKLFGAKSKEEVIGRPRLEFVANSYQKKAVNREIMIKSGYDVETVLEMELLKIDGTKIIGEVYATPLPIKNDLLSLTYIKDITEQKKMIEENKRLLQERIEYDRLKNEFFSNISHELRTPLNILLSSIQLLSSIYNNSKNNPSDFTAAFEKYVGTMKQNSYRLLKLINNIIDLTRLDCGFLQMNFGNHNIVDVVENITLSVANYTESKGINLIFDTEIEEKIIGCDNDKIERIILNLLSNAIKYTKSGGTIKVHIKNLGTNIMISIQDTGIGIPNDKLNVIFERFRQVDELLTRRAEGSGIGLSLVKSLVEAHGGTISVNSTEGVGSEFVILLPSKIVENTQTSYKHLYIMHNDDQLQKKVEKISIEFSDIYE